MQPPNCKAITMAPLFCRQLQADLQQALHSSDQDSLSAIVDGKGGVRVVDHPLHELEWAEPINKEIQCHSRNGCLTDGLGCCMSGHQERRPLVLGRAESSHQLPRNVGSIFGLQVLLQGEEKHSCPIEDGQHIGNSIHKQNGRDSVPNLKHTEQGDLAVVHGERHSSTGPAPCRGTELHSICCRCFRVWSPTHKGGELGCQSGSKKIHFQRSDSRLIARIMFGQSIQSDLSFIILDSASAFTISWKGLKVYANPPWSLVGRVLSQAHQQGADLILVAPLWKT